MVIEKENRVQKRNKSIRGPRTIVTKLLNNKDKEYILENTLHLTKDTEDTNIYVYDDFSKEKIAMRKLLWDKVKKLRRQGKYAVIKYHKTFSSELHTW